MSASIPELNTSGAGQSYIRLPELDSIPLTARVRSVIDHPHFQRLRRVRQLGPTWLVYPGATHTRFEHSLGVYGTTVAYMRSLLADPNIASMLSEEDVVTVLMAALLHDVGHYPFAHSLEALHYKGRDTPRHEALAGDIVSGRLSGLAPAKVSLARVLEREVGVDPQRVAALIAAKKQALPSHKERFLQSVISSAVDSDKMDYLWRDSVHCGVPYGRNYDRGRLLNALTITSDGDALAISEKGLVSAEIFLFCRYTMFSEVYWHHTVRAASAMLERAWADRVMRDSPDMQDLASQLLGVGDDALMASLLAEAPSKSATAHLLAGLQVGQRHLYKRLMTWSRVYDEPDAAAAYERLYALDEDGATELLEQMRKRLSDLGGRVGPHDLILDIPPRDKDKLPDIQLHRRNADGGRGSWTRLSECSHIVAGIGADFVNVVKKIRLFVDPSVAKRLAPRRAEAQQAVMDVVLAGG